MRRSLIESPAGVNYDVALTHLCSYRCCKGVWCSLVKLYSTHNIFGKTLMAVEKHKFMESAVN